MKKIAVIMAGGKGERFWPKSRNSMPKQFLTLTGDGITMIQHTVQRLRDSIPPEDILIVTNHAYASIVFEQLPEIPQENVLFEPVSKNTAPCVALAAAVIQARYQDAFMIVLSSDHLVKNTEMFLETLESACKVAEKEENLITIGITPTYPETGYGYIKFHVDGAKRCNGAFAVEKFVEKPDLASAKQYLSSGEYLWNSGMFIWKSSSIIHNMQKFMPKLYEGIVALSQTYNTPEFTQTLHTVFTSLESVSIDYGIMERAENIYTIPGNFGWDDVGGWLSLERFNPTDDNGNMILGDIITIQTLNSIVLAEQRLVALVGVEDLVVVDTKDALLICRREKAQDVEKVVETLKAHNRINLI